ncbi:hypothetical protein DYB25_010887 [Aphanomyces astaci]|uniref:O-acyltransferase WSD1 C-terminal domain-containing protein n=1 Tax=Aphanomyces astaci TaxID=112090 RepID=A0A396ZXE8_APHAT|nr:hypothetical protein DYB36_008129 [Aphanomyces astaci]RHY22208.1 hypothetical protein DYB25_010887 [Aphanomyces astaci]
MAADSKFFSRFCSRVRVDSDDFELVPGFDPATHVFDMPLGCVGFSTGRSKRLFYTTNYSVTATKGIARLLGMRATVNDVFLSCITGALRTMLMEEASMDLNEDEKRERAAVVDPSCVIRADFGGHALESLNGYVPPPPHVNMGIAIYSMADALGVSVQVDANVFRRPERFLVYLKREYVELQKRSAAMHTTFHEVDAD